MVELEGKKEKLEGEVVVVVVVVAVEWKKREPC